MIEALLYPAGAAALAVSTRKAWQRLRLSRAKHPSLTGHARMARRVAAQIPFYDYDETKFFDCDGASPAVVEQRKQALATLSDVFQTRFAKTTAATRSAESDISDLAFTSRYRVPFQFARVIRERLGSGSFLQAAHGSRVRDLDGNEFLDLSGSYGLNLFGYDALKQCIDDGADRVRDLGPVLGSYHPIVAENVARLKRISRLDEISFHMSGTEAVMQAVRLAQYHTGRRRIVRFCGAYHGWWGDVQPGIGNPIAAGQTLTLAEMSERSLKILRTRRDVACVLVNPLQALHPNTPAPSDSALIDGGRKAHFDRKAYTAWLKDLRDVCTRTGIVLILDEVFVGFRLAKGGAQEYFDVRADLVTYGKTLGGGLPVGVLCGRRDLMRRFRDDRPVDICFARGTFNSHPYVMGAMSAFLDRLERPETNRLYEDVDRVWDARALLLNERLERESIPVRVANLSSIWTVLYLQPSRYNWMLQFYLRANGLALSWVGTGRLIFSLTCTDDDFRDFADRFTAAARAMQDGGWWWDGGVSNKTIKRRVLREMLSARWQARKSPVPATLQ